MQHKATRDEQLNYWYPDSNWLGCTNSDGIIDPMQAEEILPQGDKRKAEVQIGGDRKRQLNRAGTWAIPLKFTATVSNLSEMRSGERGCPIDVEGEGQGAGLHNCAGEAQGELNSRVVKLRFLICE